jgi:hypothetical protein
LSGLRKRHGRSAIEPERFDASGNAGGRSYACAEIRYAANNPECSGNDGTGMGGECEEAWGVESRGAGLGVRFDWDANNGIRAASESSQFLAAIGLFGNWSRDVGGADREGHAS